MAFSFRDLDLSENKVESGALILRPGRYVSKVTDAVITKTATGGTQVCVTLTELNGQGSIKDYINILVPGAGSDEKKATAQRIGRDRLKSLLTFGGHRDPDNPGDINTLIGLVVGLNVEEDEYEKDGRKIKGSKPKRGGCYFDPKELGHVGGATPGGAKRDDLDDGVPF